MGETNEIKGHSLDPASIRLLPHPFCLLNQCVILGRVRPAGREPITLGIVDPKNYQALDLVRTKFEREVRVVPLTALEVKRALSLAYGAGSAPKPRPEPEGEGERGEMRMPRTAPQKRKRPSVIDRFRRMGRRRSDGEISRPIIEIVDEILLDAIRKGASDVHIETYQDEVDVRFKIDGVLFQVTTPIHKGNIAEVISRIKVMAGLDISKKRIPQDGRIVMRITREGKEEGIPIRVSILPGPHGEDAVMRILDKNAAPIGLSKLGFTPRDLELYKRLIHNPQGMILVTGPTGSGKTTTLYSTLEEINSPHNKILSAEDPIEYNLDYVNQKQVSKNFGFADLARAFLRQDPDILLIGEIRDEETADIAIKAAQTGHLILSTLHTNDSVSAVSRLRSLGIHPNMLSSALLGVLSQRLVRRICPHCIAPYEPDPKLRTLFAPKLKKERFYAGKGCDHCNYSGYKGRIGIFELFVVDPEIQRLIREDRSVEEIQEAALEQGMVPIVADALHKITRDITTMEEVVRVVPYMQIQSQLKVATLDPLSEETPSSKG